MRLEQVESSSTEKAVAENAHTQEDDRVGVDNVPPERHLGGVCELLLQLLLLLWTQFGTFFLLQATEAHHCLLAQARLLLWFCDGRDRNDEEDLLVRM